MNTLKVSDLSVSEFKKLIKETMLETLVSFGVPEVDEEEQKELEAMFGNKPTQEQFGSEKKIEL